MENRLTDNEIIKSLECCGRIKGQDCDTCPLTDLQLSECTAKVATESLDLINRQKAEIERLNEKYSRMKFNLESVLAERADHTETIKEFWEEVRKFAFDAGCVNVVAFGDKLIEKEKEKSKNE